MKSKQQLALRTETLCTLSRAHLARVEGGFLDISDSCLCNSFVCSIASDCRIGKPK